jgi:hypothetical protein
MSNAQTSGGGVGFCGLLAIVFITLKLTHYIDWSWWWILAPLWMPFIVVGFIIVMMLFAFILKEILK